ncbi:hypothetical protein ACH518_03415 [Methylomonas sp. HW2-6]|uniref:hypothetical protein n=1 Tax=Methylomonas sp. HW2-6 TaxID=3376687 RepID=UPI004042F935
MEAPIEPSFAEAIAHGKKSEAYQAQQRRLLAMQKGFSVSLATVWLMASRSQALVDNSLSFRFIHDAFQTMAAVTFLASEGMYAPAKRELRYLLESASKHAIVDLNNWNFTLEERVAYLESSIPRSSVDFIADQAFFGLSPSEEADFKASVVSQFKRLSAYVHRSPAQLRQEIQQAGKGPPESKVIAGELERFNRECFAVYDLAVFLQFQVLGPGLSGDVFVHAFDPVQHWPFHRGKFCRLLSKFFDYKVERQEVRGDS